MELSSHPLHDHIVAQVGRFIGGINNSNMQRQIAEAIYQEITRDSFLKLKVEQAIQSTEIYKSLLDLISKQPILTIIIEKDTEELREALNTLRYPQIKVMEFQTFTREWVGLDVHAHLFEPLFIAKSPLPPLPTPDAGRLEIGTEKHRGRYPRKTNELLAKYGGRPSNVEGMTWQQLYDSNLDGNFRFYKVRVSLIALDKKETH